MITVSPVRSAAHASAYFVEHVDDYYLSKGDGDAAEWFGDLAHDLGLSGGVHPAEFNDLLNGVITDDARLGVPEDMQGQSKRLSRRPGYDITFSAPKSISIAAVVVGNNNVMLAHREAVSVALDYLQKQTVTRVRIDGVVQKVKTSRLVSALFHHQTSRDLDPQVHTHCVVFNVTNSRGSTRLRALESRAFYRQQKAAEAVYQSALGARLRSMGLEVCVEGDAKSPHVELRGVPQAARALFSKRRQSIVAALKAKGIDACDATAQQKQLANLKTRKAKIEIDANDLARTWRAELHNASLDIVLKEAPRPAPVVGMEYHKVANVDLAIDSLFERDARVLEKDLVRRSCNEAMKFGVHPEAVLREIRNREVSGQLLKREWKGQEAWTTPDAVSIERHVLALEAAGRFTASATMSDVESRDVVESYVAESGQGWTCEQKIVAAGLLSNEHRFVGLQGLAGTAKTSSVLRCVAAHCRQQEIEVVGLAPTNSAVRELADGAQIRDAKTVASFLASDTLCGTRRWFIVDESSLLSTADFSRLMARVQPDDRMIFVGDRNQIGSVGAGQSFAQLQDAGMPTFYLTKVLRQTEAALREAVELASSGMTVAAIERLAGQGVVVQEANESRRYAAVVDAYTCLPVAQRENSMVIEPTRRGRAEINELIFQKLLDAGELTNRVRVELRESVDWARREKRSASSYVDGLRVSFIKTPPDSDLQAGVEYTVANVSVSDSKVQLMDSTGIVILWLPESTDASLVRVSRLEQTWVAEGCRLQLTNNLRPQKLANGDVVTLEKISGGGTKLLVRTGDQRKLWLDMANTEHRCLRLGYALTAHAAQGKTVDRVFAHLPSGSTLSNQRTTYVCISRAREEARVFTDSVEKLSAELRYNTGENAQAEIYDAFAGSSKPEVSSKRIDDYLKELGIAGTKEPDHYLGL